MRRKATFDRAFPEKNIRDCRWAPIEKFQLPAYYYLLAVPIVRLTCFTLRGHIVQDAQVSSLTSLNIFTPASGVLRSYSSSAHRLHKRPGTRKVVYLLDTELLFFVFLYGGVFSQVKWLSFQGVCLLLSAGACRDDRS